MDCGCPQKKGQRQKNLWQKYFTEIFVLDSDGVLTKVWWKISKVLFQVLCPWGSEVSFVSSLTPSLLGCFRNLWFRSFTPFFTLFGWEVLDLNCWRNSGKGEFFDQNFM
jgi:hypothetical protein